MIYEDKPLKEFEKPQTGHFNATIIDVVDLGPKQNKFGETKVKTRIVWVLDKNDSEGKPFRVVRDVNSTIAVGKGGKKSNLYEIVEGVLGHPPQYPFDDEVLLNRSNELILARETDPSNGKVYANIKAILPLPAGVVPPPIPQGFVRAKFRDQVGTVATPRVQTQAPAVAVATQPVPAAQPAPTVQAQAAPQPATGAPVVDAAF